MATFSSTKLVAELKKDNELTQGKAAQKLGITVGQLPMIQFCRAQVEAGIWKPLSPKTAAQVKIARDRDQNRWELIAARLGDDVGVAAVKRLYEEAGGDASSSYTGRGRNFSETTAPAARSGRKPAAAASKASGKPAANKPAAARGGKRGGANASQTVVRRTMKRGASNPS